MTKVLVTDSHLYDIADAIRGKNGSSTTYKPGQMAAAITALPDASVLGTKSVTQNGTYDPSDDSLDGYSGVTVNVPNSYSASDEGKVVSNGALVAQTSDTKTVNGTYDTTLNNEIVVNVASGQPVIEPLSVTQNGTYTAPSGVDGYSPVSVNVSGGGVDEGVFIDADILNLYNAVTYKNGGLGLSKPYVIKTYNGAGYPDISSAQFDGVSVPCLHRRQNDVFGLIFLTKVPKNKYTRLKIKLKLPNSSGNQYTNSAVCLISQAQFNSADGWLGYIMQRAYFTNGAMSAAEIEAQTGVTISSSDSHVLSEQTVTWELPTMSVDYYIGVQTWNVESYINALWLE